MDKENRFNLIKEVGEEILTEEELLSLLDENKHPVAYDGFEPSGNMHIAQGILRTININKMIKSGCKFKMLIADWHAWANNKYGGDLEKIQIAGEYFKEIWKACGMDLNNIEFINARDLLDNKKYWKTTMQIARNSTLKRIIRCSQIMGRSESDNLHASQIFYPCMQAADIFELNVDICQLGIDQRKVNVLAREIAPKLGYKKPVAVHHHMLMGLNEPPKGETTIEKVIEMKMSKSKPDTAIFMTDTREDIFRKIKKAYCPPKQTNENPLIEYCKYIIFEKFDKFKIERDDKFGGDIEFKNFEDLTNIYSKGDLHPMDLKLGIANHLDKLIEPVRKYFENNTKANELKEQVLSFKITR